MALLVTQRDGELWVVEIYRFTLARLSILSNVSIVWIFLLRTADVVEVAECGLHRNTRDYRRIDVAIVVQNEVAVLLPEQDLSKAIQAPLKV